MYKHSKSYIPKWHIMHGMTEESRVIFHRTFNKHPAFPPTLRSPQLSNPKAPPPPPHQASGGQAPGSLRRCAGGTGPAAPVPGQGRGALRRERGEFVQGSRRQDATGDTGAFELKPEGPLDCPVLCRNQGERGPEMGSQNVSGFPGQVSKLVCLKKRSDQNCVSPPPPSPCLP